MLKSETEPVVLAAAITALGHLGNEAGIPVMLKYLRQPDAEVRFAVAFALGCLPDEPAAVSALLELTRDEDSDVRDWAVFGFGVQGSADSADIRAALLECLSDPNEDVREEAAAALAKRKDLRVLPALNNMLDAPELKIRVAEAASALLGFSDDPPQWDAADYKDALRKQFPIPVTSP